MFPLREFFLWSYLREFDKAKSLITGENNQKIFAAALSADPDFFVLGDREFRRDRILKIFPVKKARSNEGTRYLLKDLVKEF